jgi:pilus assembly protein CpaF
MRKENEIMGLIYEQISNNLDIFEIKNLSKKERLRKIEKAVIEILEKEKTIVSEKQIKEIADKVYDESFGYGPISEIMKNDEITEIMINNYDQIYIEKNGMLQKLNLLFNSNNHVKNFIDKILSPLGLRLDESYPMVDARLNDGSRINAIVSPITFNEITVTIRKFRKSLKDINDLINLGTLNYEMAEFIKLSVINKANIIVSGATSTGKTTLLNIVSNFIPLNERIVTIEDTLELNLNIENLIRLESRPANIEGKGEITIRDLVRNSLRMRPDRIVVGEIRGVEAIDVLQAMNTGHKGSLTTIHANSPFDLVSRIETMLIMSGLNLNPSAARRIIVSSIDLIIFLERLSDGRRVVSKISEINSDEENITDRTDIEIKDIFLFDKNRYFNSYENTNDCFIRTNYKPKFLN